MSRPAGPAGRGGSPGPAGAGSRHPIGPTSRPARRPGLVAVEVDGETVVYDPVADLLHHLEASASAVWSRLDGADPLDALAVRLAADYGAGPDTVRRDVIRLARVLWDLGLLAGSDPPPPADRPPVGLTIGPAPGGAVYVQDRPLPAAPYLTRRCTALEHTFEVATNVEAVRDYLDDVLAGLADAGPGPAARHELLDLTLTAPPPPAPPPLRVDHGHEWRYVVRYGGEPVLGTSVLDIAITVLLWHVNAEVVRRSTPRYPLVHAGGVVSHGVAVLLPAPPESGKTTTVAGLLRAGFGYLTDEAVAVDPAGLLAHPYPKALSIDAGSWEVLADLRPPHSERVSGQWHVPPTQIRADAVAGPAPVRFIVTPRYQEAAPTRLQPISRAETLMTLADSTFNFQDEPARNLSVLARLVATADCYRLTIGDLDSAVRLVTELVGSEKLDVAE
jgi:hypothetical protein